ncbi:MAG: hypothetical protein HXS44_17850 [Theionarchaea archaeon]|nr:hypothetical protein [Theionarchaea archaeon]
MIHIPLRPDSYIPIFNRIKSSVSFPCTEGSTISSVDRTRRGLLILIPGSSVDRISNSERDVPELPTCPEEDYP